MEDEEHSQESESAEERQKRQKEEEAQAIARAKKKQEEKEKEDKRRAQEREQYLREAIPALNTGGLGQNQLQDLCKEYHAKISQLEEECYEWEMKLRKQEFQIQELTFQVNYEGKFMMPALKKINKTERVLSKLERRETAHTDFRTNLKSTGNKWAIDEDEKKE